MESEPQTMELSFELKLGPGQSIGRYQIEKRLGVGGMGSVFLVRHCDLGNLLALKIVNEEYMERNESALERFIKEARMMARLRCRNIVSLVDYNRDTQHGIAYIVMEYADAGSLHDLLKKYGPMDELTALCIIREIAAGLKEAHDQGVVHRDIKPGNILFTSQGDAKLTDFGVAKDFNSTSNLTMTNASVGTYSYMPPEQLEGAKKVKPCSDIFSLGVTLYQMLTGRLPFEGDSTVQVIDNIRTVEPTNPQEYCTGLSDWTKNLIKKMLEKKCDDRIASGGELLGIIEKHFSEMKSFSVSQVIKNALEGKKQTLSATDEDGKKKAFPMKIAAGVAAALLVASLALNVAQRMKVRKILGQGTVSVTEVDELKDKLKDEKEKLKDVQIKLEIKEKDLQAKDDELNNEKVSSAKQKEDLAAAAKAREDAQAVLKKAQDDLSGVLKERDALQKSYDETKAQLELVQVKRTEAEANQKKAEEEHKKLLAQLTDSTAGGNGKEAALQQQVHQLMQDIEKEKTKQGRLLEVEGERDKLLAQVKTREGELAKSRDELKQAQGEINRLQNAAAMVKDYEQVKRLLEGKKQELAKKDKELAESHDALKRANEAIEKIGGDLKTNTAALTTAVTENGRNKALVEKLEGEKKQLADEMKALNDKLAEEMKVPRSVSVQFRDGMVRSLLPQIKSYLVNPDNGVVRRQLVNAFANSLRKAKLAEEKRYVCLLFYEGISMKPKARDNFLEKYFKRETERSEDINAAYELLTGLLKDPDFVFVSNIVRDAIAQ